MTLSEQQIEAIVRQVVAAYQQQRDAAATAPDRPATVGDSPDITAESCRQQVLADNSVDAEAIARMKKSTTARIGVGRAGSRLRTRTMLQLRADHAAARDAVFQAVDPAVISGLELLPLRTRSSDKQEFLTRPDLGRLLDEDSARCLRERAGQGCDVQLVVSDGLSSTAVSANIADFLSVLRDELRASGLSLGQPLYVENGRVGVGDHIAELTGAKVTCVLLGERPGLATAESMSAYVTYNARIGIPESSRNVVSNIHRNGLPPVEAGAFVADLIKEIYTARKSGVELRK